MNKKIIGIAGFARSGKDTLAKTIASLLEEKGKKTRLFSFAKALKSDIDNFCVEKFNISAFCDNSDLKAKIRPMLIAYGNCQRESTLGTYWINRLKPDIDIFFKNGGEYAIVSDLRFKEFEYDEYDFFRSFVQNFVFPVSLFNRDGKLNDAAHESEKKSFPFFLQNSDHNIEWAKSEDESYIREKANECIKLITNKYEQTK
jgi:hypothetical protein